MKAHFNQLNQNNMKATSKLLGIALAAVLLSCGNSKDTTDRADSTNEAMADRAREMGDVAAVDEDDAEFAVKAANGGMAEVEMSELAENKATDPGVKDFARMMITDHSQANEELKALAAQKNIALPSSPDEDKREILTRLSARSGKDFDKAYIREMVKDHEKDVKLFEDGLLEVRDAELRAFIEKTLPVLRKHLTHIKQLDSRK